METNKKIWCVLISGSQPAKERWSKRWYKLRSSAKRRVDQIRAARDLGVCTIWTINTDEFTEFRETSAVQR